MSCETVTKYEKLLWTNYSQLRSLDIQFRAVNSEIYSAMSFKSLEDKLSGEAWSFICKNLKSRGISASLETDLKHKKVRWMKMEWIDENFNSRIYSKLNV